MDGIIDISDVSRDSNVTEEEENNSFAQSEKYEGISKEEFEKRDREYQIRLKNRRVRWARRILIAIFVYIAIILTIFIAIGFLKLSYDSSVVNVFLGTTSVHIIGLAYVVAKWLFPQLKTDS